jgi:hypothetical protein
MSSWIFDYFSQVNRSIPIPTLVIRLINLVCVVRESKMKSILKRYVLANSIRDQKSKLQFEQEKNIEIVFLVTKKDNKIFEFSLSYADNLALDFDKPIITVITPSSNIDNLAKLQSRIVSKLRIIDEEIFLTEKLKEKILKNFPTRYGWVLQQFIKIDFVRGSQAKGVLVIDADTLLLRNRVWLYKNGMQLLTPTFEYHRPYYEILNRMINSPVDPQFTFVPHHMLFQPQYMREIFLKLNWRQSIDVFNSLEPMIQDANSPFSIDYELYAQYMYTYHVDKVFLGKWSNRSMGFSNYVKLKDKYFFDLEHQKYFSVSCHDYLKK